MFEGLKMAEKDKKEEKFYTPAEVAMAVLKKAQELMKKSALFKATNSAHEIEVGEEPNNEDAECPPSLEEADIENSGAHGEKKAKKAKTGDIASADKDGDGDIDGNDAIEAQEELSGKDLDGDGEAGEKPEHKEKIEAAAKPALKADEDKEADEKIKDASKDEKDKKKPPFVKSEKGCEPKMDLKKPSLKKFMLGRKMKKSGGPTADERQAEKLSGIPAAPAPKEKVQEFKTPAQKVKDQSKLQMEKNKETEKLLGIKPKAGK